MFNFIEHLLSRQSLSPHGICLTWRPELIWTHVVADATIGLSYFSIPIALATFVSRRRDIAFGGLFWSFALFILACGTTHFMSIWTLWVADYGLEALIKVLTAIASVATAVALWWLLPQALVLPSPADLRQANEALTARIIERDGALAALAASNVERQRTEEMLRQSQKMEAIGQFTGGVAHDFNNLLAIIMTNLDRLDRRVSLDERGGRAVKDATVAADRAAALVAKLLAFSRKQPLLPTIIDVNGLLRDIEPLLTNALQGVTITTALTPVDTVPADANQLTNAILNIALNARDAMRGTGTVVIRTRMSDADQDALLDIPPDRYVVIEVEDSGCGMSADVAKQAFEPFYTTKAVGEGTGLGLSQVIGFATQSGGTARLSSTIGQGTRVALYLPRAPTCDRRGVEERTSLGALA